MTRHSRSALLVLLVVATPRLAAAEPHKLLVMQSEGRADSATRAKIDAAILKLARASDPQAAAGELNFSDAATAVGCKPEAPSCKDEVLGMLAVDEIVITSVARKPGGLEITVQRVGRGGAGRDAQMLLATGTTPDKLDGIAPLFTDPPAPAAPPPPEPTSREPVLPPPSTLRQPPPPSVVTIAPSEPLVPPSANRHRLEIAGMAGGGGLVILSFFLWGAARGTQSEINTAPTMTRQDLTNLRDLESRGDAYAAFGNLFAISGLVVGSLGTYFYLQDRRHAAAPAPVARITPTVVDHGGGLMFTFGGLP